MKSLTQRRARIARVRKIEHARASASAAEAEGRVIVLEQHSSRLHRLATDLTPGAGSMFGAALSNAGELAQRLRDARTGLADAISGAKASALESSLARIEARIRQESADRLEVQAQTQLHEAMERRRETPFRTRVRNRGFGDT